MIIMPNEKILGRKPIVKMVDFKGCREILIEIPGLEGDTRNKTKLLKKRNPRNNYLTTHARNARGESNPCNYVHSMFCG